MRYFLLDNGVSRKYWNVSLNGQSRTITYGRVGCKPTEKIKMLGSKVDARLATEELICKKRAKGFSERFPHSVSFEKLKTTSGIQIGYDPATEDQIEQLEREFICKLPADYRAFLQKTNGGFPSVGYIDIPQIGCGATVSVGTFRGLAANSEAHMSIARAARNWSETLTKGHVPIAGDSDIFSVCVKRLSLIHI